jgi:hypothetical protein
VIRLDTATYVIGLVIGSGIFAVVCISYLRGRAIDRGTIVLCTLGVILIGLSILKAVNVNLGKGQLDFELVDRSVQPGVAIGVPNLSGTASAPITYRVEVINQSSSLADSEVEKVSDAVQKQIKRDFAPNWGINADIRFVPRGGQASPNAWPIFIESGSDETNSLSYHFLTKEGRPAAKVFPDRYKEYGGQWSISVSHELINMLVDPRANLSVWVGNGSDFYSYEPANPCGGTRGVYSIDGVIVSNFVFPSWFVPRDSKQQGRLDFLAQSNAPFNLCSGGNIAYFDVKAGGWQWKTQP